MFDTEPRSQTQAPDTEVKMTLDEFQKNAKSITQKLKDEVLSLLQEGIKSGLDPELMLVIINRELFKIGEGV